MKHWLQPHWSGYLFQNTQCDDIIWVFYRDHSVRGRRRWSGRRWTGGWRRTRRNTPQSSPRTARTSVKRWAFISHVLGLLNLNQFYNRQHILTLKSQVKLDIFKVTMEQYCIRNYHYSFGFNFFFLIGFNAVRRMMLFIQISFWKSML